MGSWEYRVVERDGLFAIHEAYDLGDAKLSVTEKPVPVLDEQLTGLQVVLDMMARALLKPVLKWEDL